MELVRFLQSRIAEDTALAPVLHSEKCRLFVGRRDWTWCDCGYPARAFAEVEAKRRIVEAARERSPEVEPGDVIIHHPLTLHYSTGNASATGRRRGLALRYVGEDATWDARPGTFMFWVEP